MRKVIYGGACSLDGFFTDRTGAVDWLHWSKDVEQIMARSWAETDTMLMGRKTWEVAMSAGGGGDMPGITIDRTYVFSRTLKTVSEKRQRWSPQTPANLSSSSSDSLARTSS